MNRRPIAIIVSFLTLAFSVHAFAGPACCASAARAPAEPLDSARLLLAAYEEISNALAADNLAEAREAARTLAAVSEITETPLSCPALTMKACCKGDGEKSDARSCANGKKCCQEEEKCLKSVQDLIQAGDIDQARTHFRFVSAQAIELAREKEGFFVMNCPMAGEHANWLQSDQEVRNPYHGKAMLRCGGLKSDEPVAAACH